jgi:hypothetical protein
MVVMMKKIKPYGNLENAKIMVIGSENQIHNLNKKNEDFCFFSDYFFKPIPSKKSELKKYKTACQVFSLINYLTNFKYTADQIYLTYLWNEN